MRHLLAPIYANAEFLEHHDIGVSERADLLREIRQAVLAMTERIDSLLQFGKSGRREFVEAPVSLVIEKAIVADWRENGIHAKLDEEQIIAFSRSESRGRLPH